MFQQNRSLVTPRVTFANGSVRSSSGDFSSYDDDDEETQKAPPGPVDVCMLEVGRITAMGPHEQAFPVTTNLEGPDAASVRIWIVSASPAERSVMNTHSHVGSVPGGAVWVNKTMCDALKDEDSMGSILGAAYACSRPWGGFYGLGGVAGVQLTYTGANPAGDKWMEAPYEIDGPSLGLATACAIVGCPPSICTGDMQGDGPRASLCCLRGDGTVQCPDSVKPVGELHKKIAKVDFLRQTTPLGDLKPFVGPYAAVRKSTQFQAGDALLATYVHHNAVRAVDVLVDRTHAPYVEVETLAEAVAVCQEWPAMR